ncbi:MAG TPA: aspartate/glutamate racemase family protein [Ramlibacter sp.]|nr:aspartate/glutamate racemase family protein [Ramlibacter sp.]
MPRFLGVLTLDTQFPRLVGDIGNPASFGVPVLTRTVRDMHPHHAVQSAAGQRAAGLFMPFCRVMRELEDQGAAAITTSCGFLVLMQEQLQAQARVPVVTSSLMMLPGLLEKHRRVGVLTVSALHLGEEFLAASGVAASRMDDVVIEGVDREGEFARAMLDNRSQLDFARARRDVVEAARRLRERDRDITDVVLECTNMPPYAAAIGGATGLRCWSLLQSEVLLAPLRR